MQSLKFWLSREVILSAAFILLIAVPVIALGNSEEIFVDKDNKGTENGSASHPYRTISKALKHADEGTEVRIASGTYKENITIPKGVKLFGKQKDKGKVVIKSEKNDQPAVTMKHQTELNYLTIEGGRHGVRVLEDAKAKIFQVKIKKSNRDGIHIDSAPREKKYRMLIDTVDIEKNDRAGIFSEKRDIVIMNSYIHENGTDGIDFAGGMKGWLEDNKIHSNWGSGIKMTLDRASVWTKSNSIRYNHREGIELNSFGVAGEFGLKKASVINSNHYGIARVARNQGGLKGFGGLVLGTDVNKNRIEGNKDGAVSSILPSF